MNARSSRRPWQIFIGLLVIALVVLFGAPKAAVAMPFFMNDTTDIVDMDSAMKIYFTDPIVNNVVTDTELLSVFLEDNNVQIETTTGGRYIETAQYFQLPAGVGFRAHGEYIPVPDGPQIVNSRIYLKKVQAVSEMEGDVMERVRTNIGAYVDWMERALPDILIRLNDTIDRALLGYGNGALARIDPAWDAVGQPTTIPINRSFGVTGWTMATKNFLQGMRIVASADADSDPLRNAGAGQSAKVTDVNRADQEITVDAVPAAWADNDFLFPGDSAGHSGQTAAGDDREIMGLAGMVDDGSILPTFQNLLRSSYRLWQGLLIDGTAGDFASGVLSEDVFVYADDEVSETGAGRPNLIVTSRAGARSYWRDLRADRSLNDPRAYEGGKGPLTVQLSDRKIPIKVARKMPPELAYMLQTDTFRRWQVDNGKWDDKTGAIWNRVTDGTGRKDAFYAVYNWYLQTGNIAPAKNVRILTAAA
jgi:hypothetical protein